VGHQLGAGCLESDLDRILASVRNPQAWQPPPEQLEAVLRSTGEAALRCRWQAALERINPHWDRLHAGEKPLASPSRDWLWFAARLRPIGSLAGRLSMVRSAPGHKL